MNHLVRRAVAGVGVLLVAGGILLIQSAQAVTGPAAVGSATTSEVDRGRSLFVERCATCHGVSAQGTSQGPSILDLGAAAYDFQMSTGRMPLEQPTDQPVRRRPVLTRSEIDAIMAYLESLSFLGPGIPDVHPELGDSSKGEGIYQLNCAACHGVTGNGGAVGPQRAPDVHEATLRQVAEAVRTGPGTMPLFGRGVISVEDMNSLLRYVQYLREPDDRGGAGLNHVGPLIEGFVAVVIGLGILVLATRFIGERS